MKELLAGLLSHTDPHGRPGHRLTTAPGRMPGAIPDHPLTERHAAAR